MEKNSYLELLSHVMVHGRDGSFCAPFIELITHRKTAPSALTS